MYAPTQIQRAFHGAEEKEVIFAGNRAVGKTHALVAEALKYALIREKAEIIYMMRWNNHEYVQSLIAKIINSTYQFDYSNLKKSCFVKKTGSRIRFFDGETGDLLKYTVGMRADLVLIDEIDVFKEDILPAIYFSLLKPDDPDRKMKATMSKSDDPPRWCVNRYYVPYFNHGDSIKCRDFGHDIKIIRAECEIPEDYGMAITFDY